MELLLLWINLVGLSVLYIAIRRVSGGFRLYLPDAFVLATGSHAIGSLMLWGQRESQAIQFISEAAFLSFALATSSTICAMALTHPRMSSRNSSYYSKHRTYDVALVLIIIANLGIVGLIFSNPAIGVMIIAAFTASDDTTLLVARKAITASTEGYMSPGLIKLVRDLISPIVLVSFVLSRSGAFRSVLFWIAVFSTLLSILIGGQRFPFLLVIIALAAGILGRRKIEGQGSRLGVFQALRYGFAILVAFFAMSYFLGRTQDGANGLEGMFWTLYSLFERIMITVPFEAEKTYAFWSEIGPTGGSSWLQDLAILMPGQAQSSFSSQLHVAGGGSAQGNAPLFFAIDAWFAFGWFGILLACLLFVLLLHVIDMVLWRFRSPRNDAARIVLFLNVPLMYSPFLFLLYGGLIVLPIVFWTLLTRGFFANRRNSPLQT